MFVRTPILRSTLVLGLTVGLGTLYAAAESKQAADSFVRKIGVINQHAAVVETQGARNAAPPRRTPLTETEVNSWFMYKAQPLLPEGLTQPKVTIVGGGKVIGGATVDLEAIGKRRSSGGGTLDLWSYLGGRVPITVTGLLHTKDGKGRFELQAADISGVPVPKALLQEVVAYYSRTPDHPQGIRLDDPFELPAQIKQIEVGQGQAVVVQ